jgi:hypothetical protein
MPGLPNDRQRTDQMPVSRTRKTRKLCLRSHPAWVRRSRNGKVRGDYLGRYVEAVMPTTIAFASPTTASPITGIEDAFLAVIGNRDLNVITLFSMFGFVMTILFAVYLGSPDDPAALLIQTSNASQINVAQDSLGLAGTFAGKGDAERREVASVAAPLQPVPDADGVALADYQPLMATGLDLNGPPRRFSAKELLRSVEIPQY